MKKPGKHLQVASLRAGKIDNRPASEEQTKHRTDPMKCDVDFCFRDRLSRELFELRTERFEQFPTVDSFQLAQLRETSCHRQRISRQCSGLINGAVGRKPVHDFRASAECANWQAAADNFSKGREIRCDAVDFLS